jgi:molecular chaperone HtpG
VVKEGVDSDYDNRDALLKLLLFGSSRDSEALTTLKEYVERMPEGQSDVWYLTGASREQIENSPALETFRERGWEVLYLVEPVDELVMQSVRDYEGKRCARPARARWSWRRVRRRRPARRRRRSSSRSWRRCRSTSTPG